MSSGGSHVLFTFIFPPDFCGSIYATLVPSFSAHLQLTRPVAIVLHRGPGHTQWFWINSACAMKLNWAWTAAKISFYKNIISRRSRRTGAVQPGMGDARASPCPSCGARETNDIEISSSSLFTLPALGVLLRVYSLTKTICICIFRYIILSPRVSSHNIHACALFYSSEVMKGDLNTPRSAQQALLSYQHYSNEHSQLPPLHQPFYLEIQWKVLQQLFHWSIRITFRTGK